METYAARSEQILRFYQTLKYLPKEKFIFEPTDKHFELVSLLEAQGFRKEGYRLRILGLRGYPNKKVSIQIEHDFRDVCDHWYPFVRIDWKPDGQHSNYCKRKVIVITGSHIHPPEENLKRGIKAIMDNLPYVAKLSEEPENWQDLMKIAGKLLKVAGMEEIQKPDWCPILI